ncbi:sugar MFS transporter [Roseiflexus sp.]|uniref:MFS transporter n=1 Tax=Roseiflexus sp. TaxID=2562120 RepID=UPI0021DBF204|nr:MFS transporter [Roseiflexus sp.]GIW01934.1 MAG: putative major facilitator superfamily protein [Roseiflexus sp.]
MEPKTLANHLSAASIAWRPGIAMALLMGYFVLFGMTVGGQGVLWADIIHTLRISEGAFGSVQLLPPLIAMGLLVLGGPLTVRFGKKRLAITGLIVLGLSSLGLAAASDFLSFSIALALSGLGFGAVEMAMNSATLDWEQQTQRPVMNLMHAGFSGGAVTGAFAAGGLLQTGWIYAHVLWLLAAFCAIALLATLPARYPPAAPTHTTHNGAGAALRLLIDRRALLAFAVLSMFGVVGESVANTWSVIYLRDLGAAAFVGGTAYALFNGTMFVGRLANAPFVARFGARTSLLTSGTLVIIAGLLLIIPDSIPAAVVAFALAGLGVAGVVPTALSEAARHAPGSSGAVTGAIMAVTYLSFVVCAPLIGWIAELVSLQTALLTVALSGIGIVGLARGIAR